MEIERSLGFEPIDREFEKLGYDIESRVPGTGKLRFIEVKGRVSGAETITVTATRSSTRSTSPTTSSSPSSSSSTTATHRVHYLRQPFQREPDFGVTSVNYASPSCSDARRCHREMAMAPAPPVSSSVITESRRD